MGTRALLDQLLDSSISARSSDAESRFHMLSRSSLGELTFEARCNVAFHEAWVQQFRQQLPVVAGTIVLSQSGTVLP